MRIGAGKMDERPRVAHKIIQVFRLRTLPYQGTPEVLVCWLNAETDNLASVINGVATPGDGPYRSRKRAIVLHTGVPGPEKCMDCAIVRRLRRADHLAMIIDAACNIRRASQIAKVGYGAIPFPQDRVARNRVAYGRGRQTGGRAQTRRANHLADVIDGEAVCHPVCC